MNKKFKNIRKKSSSAILSFTANSWALTGQEPTRPKIKRPMKRKIKIYLEIKKKRRNNKICGFLKKN